MDFLKGLNPQQREAVACTEGPLLILAGAGSGKTRVITHRIAYIITERHVPPSAILAVTFTNKAAQEMRARVAALLSRVELDSAPNLSTFHSFCVRLLRRDGEPLAQLRPGFTRRFSIYDDEDQLALIKAAFRHLGLDEKFMQYRAALSRISHAKNLKETPQDFYRKANDPTASKLAVIWDEYEKALLTANALDFDDLLLETVRLLHHDEATRGLYNRRLSYIMIDEYQDTNRSQYELMRLLSQTHGNVCVVGDEDQSIYSWRGADIQNILDFEHDFPRARVHPAGTELPLDEDHPGSRRRGSGEEQGTQRQDSVDRGGSRRDAGRVRRMGRGERRHVHRQDHRAAAGGEPQSARGRSVPDQLAIAADRRSAAAAWPASTWWWADSVFISAPKSKTPSPI